MQLHRRRVSFQKILIALCIMAVVYCLMLYFDEQQDCCGEHAATYLPTSGYTRELGIKSFDEESILQVYGVPSTRTRWVDPEQNDRTLILDQYPTFDALYVYTDWYEGEPYNELIQIVFKSDTLRFGRRKIGIGSTKEEVRNAYKRDEKIDEEDLAYCAVDLPEVDEGYFGESWCFILFCYGKDGTVISMAMQPSAFWGW